MDEERPGRPADVVSEETIEKIHDMILDDRRTKAREVAKAIGVSIGTAIYVLYAKLAMKKWSTRWVTRMLTVDNNPMRLLTSQHCLKQFKGDLKNFLRRVVIIDEAWIRHYTPETTQQSRQWISPDAKEGEYGPIGWKGHDDDCFGTRSPGRGNTTVSYWTASLKN